MPHAHAAAVHLVGVCVRGRKGLPRCACCAGVPAPALGQPSDPSPPPCASVCAGMHGLRPGNLAGLACSLTQAQCTNLQQGGMCSLIVRLCSARGLAAERTNDWGAHTFHTWHAGRPRGREPHGQPDCWSWQRPGHAGHAAACTRPQTEPGSLLTEVGKLSRRRQCV